VLLVSVVPSAFFGKFEQVELVGSSSSREFAGQIWELSDSRIVRQFWVPDFEASSSDVPDALIFWCLARTKLTRPR
jgi:hypothetical protein